MGDCIRNGCQWFKDRIYFLYAGGIPFTGAWYAPHWITATLGSQLPLNSRFIFYTVYMFLHALGSLFFCYGICQHLGISVDMSLLICVSLIGSYCHFSCHFSLISTVTWFLGIVYGLTIQNAWLVGASIWLALGAGYWTYLMIMSIPMLFCTAQLREFPYLAFLAIPQFITTAWYMSKSIRMKSTYEEKARGSVPPWYFLTLIIPFKLNTDVLYPELRMNIGRAILPFFFFCTNPGLYFMTFLSAYMMTGKYVKAPIPLRLPCKWIYLFIPSLILTCANGLYKFPDLIPIVLLLQTADILIFQKDLLFKPFSEFGRKPSVAFEQIVDSEDYRVSNLPFPQRAGYINFNRTLGYKGGCSLQVMADYFGYDSNGASSHNWYDYKDTDGSEFGIKYHIGGITNKSVTVFKGNIFDELRPGS